MFFRSLRRKEHRLRGQMVVARLLAVGLIGVLVGGCGGSKSASHNPSASAGGGGATATVTVTTTTTDTSAQSAQTATTNPTAGMTEEAAPSVVYDYASSADCLDQYSGAEGDNRGRNGLALVYTVRVPKDETEQETSGARLFFYPSEAIARNHVSDSGYLPPKEKRVIGNVIIDGDAARHPYATEVLINCLKF
jgi:hypothetical protein